MYIYYLYIGERGGGEDSRPVERGSKVEEREFKREKMIFLYGQLFSKIGWGGLREGGQWIRVG